jgi:hypothetical protein
VHSWAACHSYGVQEDQEDHEGHYSIPAEGGRSDQAVGASLGASQQTSVADPTSCLVVLVVHPFLPSAAAAVHYHASSHVAPVGTSRRSACGPWAAQMHATWDRIGWGRTRQVAWDRAGAGCLSERKVDVGDH